MLNPNDQAELDAAIQPFRWLVLSMVVIVPMMFVMPCVGIFLLVPTSLLLPVLGARVYSMNVRRIAEGKTSITVGRSGAHASYDHRVNQASNVFYMAAGGVIMALTLTAPLRWLFGSG